MQIKWMWNGIKVDGKLYRAHYSKDNRVDGSLGITVYARDYHPGFPRIEGLNIKNESDGMTDYFETDSIWIEKFSPFYASAYEAWKKSQEKENARMQKRSLKYGFTFHPVEVA